MKNIFSNIGDKDNLELYKGLRLATIINVDEDKAVVSLQWLDKSGGRRQVPLSMPFCEQGWGIYAMPRKYGIVVCLTRPYEFPVIIAYIPPNFMGLDSSWKQFKQQSNMPQDFKSGEIILRNMIPKAKCRVCKVVSTFADWAANYGYVSGTLYPTLNGLKVEKCPSCNVPAFILDANKIDIKTVNKIQMGILIYMKQDGKMRIKLNDGLDASDGFTKGSIVDILFDENSNLTVTGIQNLNISSDNTTINAGGNNSIVLDKDGNITAIVASGKKINLGKNNASEPGVLGNQIKQWLETHTHPTGVGPSGPPSQPVPNSAFSQKVALE